MKNATTQCHIMMVQRGFSLVELSVVIFIIGIILGMGLNLSTNIVNSDRRGETEARIARIEQAIALYVVENGYLPCPAPNDPNNDNGQIGACSAPATEAGTADIADADGVVEGAIPYAALGLDQAYQLDSWNRRFRYVVFETAALADPAAALPADRIPLRDIPQGGTYITVNRGDTGQTTIASNVLYLIISHGANGFGGWNANGSAQIVNTQVDLSANEEENQDDDDRFVSHSFSSAASTNGLFDDIVVFKTKFQIADQPYIIKDAAVCLAAQNAVFQGEPATDEPVEPTCCIADNAPCGDTRANYSQECLEMAETVLEYCFDMDTLSAAPLF